MNCNVTSPGNSELEWKFNSLVCFDLETTGLPEYGRVKITEFAFVGVVRSHLEHQYINSLPRVLHKLAFTVYPQKPISYEASIITGLWNDQLEHIKPWNMDTYQMLLGFLNLLPAPVCIVAHNGYKFDFPIFKQHLEQINHVFPDHFIFVDSLPAFQKILREEVLKSSSLIEQMVKDMDSYNEDLMRVAEEVEANLFEEVITKNPEVTPNSKVVPGSTNLKMKKRVSPASEISILSTSKIRKCLFPIPNKIPKSFSLGDIYSHLHNERIEGCHNAEADAVTLLKCISKIAPEFLKYANNNNKTFNLL